MPTPTVIRRWKKKVILCGLETTYNTDPGLVNTDWFEAQNVSLTPCEVESQDRPIVRPWMGNDPKLITAKRMKLSFEVALAASGTLGTAPKIARFLLGAGNAETVTPVTKVEYTLISESFDSLAFYINIDGVLHKGTGGRCNISYAVDAKGLALMKVDITSLYIAPVDAAAFTEDRTGWPLALAVNSANVATCTLNGVASFYSKFSLDFGNKVQHHNYPGGYEEVAIDDRAPSASMSILAPLLATFDPFALEDAQTIIPIQTVIGSAAGKKVQIDVDATITNVAYEDIDGHVGYSLSLMPLWSGGNNEIKTTFI